MNGQTSSASSVMTNGTNNKNFSTPPANEEDSELEIVPRVFVPDIPTGTSSQGNILL